MGFIGLLTISIGLSMDAFAASICKGLSSKKFNLRMAIIVGLFFGLFQAGMPLIGYLLGVQFHHYINRFDHWIAFILLSLIGLKMIVESRQNDSHDRGSTAAEGGLDYRELFLLAFSTSVDALAAGVGFAFLEIEIVPAVIFIGSVTFLLSVIGVKIGNVIGAKYMSKAEFAGGMILLFMGTKILLEPIIF